MKYFLSLTLAFAASTCFSQVVIETQGNTSCGLTVIKSNDGTNLILTIGKKKSKMFFYTQQFNKVKSLNLNDLRGGPKEIISTTLDGGSKDFLKNLAGFEENDTSLAYLNSDAGIIFNEKSNSENMLLRYEISSRENSILNMIQFKTEFSKAEKKFVQVPDFLTIDQLFCQLK